MKKHAKKKAVSSKTIVTKDPASVPARIGRVFENKMQFEEAVLQLLRDHDRQKPAGVFY